MDLTESEDLEDNLESASSRSREEDYLYELIDTKLDKLYQVSQEGYGDEVQSYHEQLRQLYQSVDPVELDRII